MLKSNTVFSVLLLNFRTKLFQFQQVFIILLIDDFILEGLTFFRVFRSVSLFQPAHGRFTLRRILNFYFGFILVELFRAFHVPNQLSRTMLRYEKRPRLCRQILANRIWRNFHMRRNTIILLEKGDRHMGFRSNLFWNSGKIRVLRRIV